MRAIRAAQTGDPEVMKVEELPTPAPGPGEVLVRVEAAGVNFIDIYQRSGAYKVPLPFAPGLEGAGIVEAVGEGVRDVAPGLRVAWCAAPGSYASHVRVPAEKAVPVPASIDGRIAAAAMLQGLTAHYLTHTTYPLRPGDTCVIHAGAGGVGLLLTQMAKAAGARVIATVSTEAKAELSRGAGADVVVLYTRDDFVAATHAATGGRGAQVVYDSVGQTTFDAGLRALAPRGVMVLYGQSSGPVPPFDPQRLAAGGSLFLTRPTLVHFTRTREELLGRSRDLFGWIEGRALSVRIGATFPLAEAAAAHRALASRATTGKVLLLP
ncbi:MAG TPA: quinone oxidoreductase [Haliangiales bacterium]|nr:quinone oxidoreductase [Haliangiales bacterium]